MNPGTKSSERGMEKHVDAESIFPINILKNKDIYGAIFSRARRVR